MTDRIYNDKINPSHYRNGFPTKPLECIEVAEHLPFCLGNAIKYIWRAGKKEGEDWRLDLEKARWYLERQSLAREYPHGLEQALEVMRLVETGGILSVVELTRFETLTAMLSDPCGVGDAIDTLVAVLE